MSTDEQLEQRLREAGERWRSVHDTPAVVDWERPGAAPRAGRRRLLLAAVSGVLVAAAVVAAVIVATSPWSTAHSSVDNPAAGKGALIDVRWAMVQVRDPTGQVSRPARSAYVTVTGSHLITGNDGCNGFGGPVRISGNRLVPGELAETAIGCPRGARDTIDALLAAGPISWSIDRDRLTLTNKAGTIVCLAASPAGVTTDPSALAGVTWALASIATKSGSASGSSGPAATLRFTGDTVVIGDGCSTDSPVRAGIGRGTLDIEAYHYLTQQSCAAVRRALMAVLYGRSSWRISGDRLTITKGATSLVYDSPARSGPSGPPSASSSR